MKNTLSFILLIGFFILTSCQPATKKSSSDGIGLSSDSLRVASEKMQEYIDNGKLAGVSTLIYKDGEIIFRENKGFADIENQFPIKDNTIYRIFSMTKPITGVALMTLFDEGKFMLDDKVAKYIPEFEGAKVYNAETKELDDQIEELTIRHLLTHTSGIPYGWDQKAYVDSLYREIGAGGWESTIGEKVKLMAGVPLKNQPGTKWEYGLSIDVAGYLIEVLSGMPLDEFFKTRIFDPLKMEDSGFYVPEEKLDRFSDVFEIKDGKVQEIKGGMSDAFKAPVSLLSGGGGLTSTMDDYLRFCRMLLNGGELDGVRILEESTVKLIMSDQMPNGLTYKEGYGYGLAGSFNLSSHEYGWAGAASTKFWIDPQNEMIVLFFAQLMPSNFKYADSFKKLVDKSVIK